MNFLKRYGNWAIVAGASEGLGAEYAHELASRGLNLILIARREDLLQSLAKQLIEKYKIRAKPLVLDLSLPDAAEQVIHQTMDFDIGLLIYNAAFSAVGPLLDHKMDEHMRELHTNIHTPYKLVYLLGQHLLDRGRGGIVLMSSLSAFQGSAYISTYAATKAFNIVLAESLWEEWRSSGVDVLAIFPELPGGTMLDFDQAPAFIEAGRVAAEKALAAWMPEHALDGAPGEDAVHDSSASASA